MGECSAGQEVLCTSFLMISKLESQNVGGDVFFLPVMFQIASIPTRYRVRMISNCICSRETARKRPVRRDLDRAVDVELFRIPFFFLGEEDGEVAVVVLDEGDSCPLTRCHIRCHTTIFSRM